MGRFLESAWFTAAYAACLGIAVIGMGCGGESAGERTGLRFEGTEPGDCIDDADNDADGLFDCNDPGCAGAATCSGGGTGGIGGAAGMSGSGGIAGSGGIGGSGGIVGSGGMGGSGGIAGSGGIGGSGGIVGSGGMGGSDGIAGSGGIGGSGGIVGSGGMGGTGGTACQSVTITPTRSIPNVMFLVDQSASMTADFGGGLNRWEAAHTAITGIVSDPLDDIVRFGLTTYTSRNGFQAGRTCPLLPTQIDFAFNNSTTFESEYPYTYPSADGEDTPTGDSINALVSQLLLDLPDDGPTIIVLATDGLPDSCECADNWPNPIDDSSWYCEGPPTPTDPQIEAVMAAAAAHAAGIDVFPLWVGDLDPDPSDPTRMHVQAVADAGVEGTGTVWVGDDPTSLAAAFQSIVSDSISCDIQMEEQFVDTVTACNEGDVRLDDVPILCSETDGWRVKTGENQVIELVGTACDTFKSGDVTFTAEFPCGAIIVE